MNEVAKFSKVSFEQFVNDYLSSHGDETEKKLKQIYDSIELPKRSTGGSAGYDFYLPFDCHVNNESTVLIPTGIRCEIDPGWFLMLMPRSGLGFKFGMRLLNTVGIIDSDYFNAKNEGHIMAKCTSDKRIILNAGDRFMQGIFLPYGVTKDDTTDDARVGGFGSTGI